MFEQNGNQKVIIILELENILYILRVRLVYDNYIFCSYVFFDKNKNVVI